MNIRESRVQQIQYTSLTDRLGKALRNLRGVGKLSEENMAEALKEVRTALLGADVHFRVAREFVDRVKKECIGQEVTKSVTPGQMVVNIINKELIRLLGEGTAALVDKKPLRILLVGLHGSGKTTTAVKLARRLRSQGYRPLVAACDVYRPAAIDQLETLAAQESIQFYANRDSKNVPAIAREAVEYAKKNDADAVIFDTAGRLQIDEELIEEIKKVRQKTLPHEVLLVADSALGQEAVNVAKSFHEAVELSGIILTKLDGDARGGAALSMKTVTGVPIKFAGAGEKMDDLEVFHPDRMASRILGMGDVVSLVEKVQETVDKEEAEVLAKKLRSADFNLEDFLNQLKQVKKMGSMGSLMKMIPGAGDIEFGDKEEKQMKRTESIILSMTPGERQNPRILSGSRRKRIADGSGVQVREVNALLKQFTQMRKMMKKMKGTGGKKMMRKMQAMTGGRNRMPGLGGM